MAGSVKKAVRREMFSSERLEKMQQTKPWVEHTTVFLGYAAGWEEISEYTNNLHACCVVRAYLWPEALVGC